MAAMVNDIKTRLNTPTQREPIEGIRYSEVLYADDTLMFGNYARNINLLLKEMQTESRYYNMELNLDKCINFTLNRKQSSIKFADGSLVPSKHTATYLGTLLTDNVDNKQEVMNRIADSIRTCNRLKLFWTKAQDSISWEIQAFHSILWSKLFTG